MSDLVLHLLAASFYPNDLSYISWTSMLREILQELVKVTARVADGVAEADCHLKEKEVICFSPLEATKTRTSGLSSESLKIKRVELSQKITFALIPALLLISKSSLTTSLLIFSVYWQIYGFVKEIFLDYIHHDVTRTWVLVYFKLLLLILAKDTIIHFGLV